MDPRQGYQHHRNGRGAPPYLGPPLQNGNGTHQYPPQMEPPQMHYGTTTYSSVKDSSSWILWQGHDNTNRPTHNSRQSRLWSALLAVAVFVVILIVLAIAALAIYMGAMRLDSGKYLIFDGSLRVTYGDRYTAKLSNHSSNEFKEKSNKYKTMVENLYNRSELGSAIRYCSITGFANGSLVVFFRLILDRRKIPKKLTNVEDTAKSIIQDEANSLKPVALKNIRVDPKQIFIKRNMEQSISYIGEENNKNNNNDVNQNNVATEVRNGVVRKAQTTSESTVTRDNKTGHRSESVLKGSYKVTTSEESSVKKIPFTENEEDITAVHNSTSQLLVENFDSKRISSPPRSTISSIKSKVSTSSIPPPSTRRRIEFTSSITNPSETMNPNNMHHNTSLTSLVSLKKDLDEKPSETLTATVRVSSSTRSTEEITGKEEFTVKPDLITLSPYVFSAGEEPWKPILPDDFTRHPQRRPAVTEEYSYASGVGVAEVILDSSEDRVESLPEKAEILTDLLNSNKRISSSGSFALGQKTFERYRHEGPRSNDQVSTFQLNIRSDNDDEDDGLPSDVTVLHTGSGDIIRKPDIGTAGLLMNDEETSFINASSQNSYSFPDYAAVKRFHNLDAYLKSYTVSTSKTKDDSVSDDDIEFKNTGRSSNGVKFDTVSSKLSSNYKHSQDESASSIKIEYASSELPVVTLIPVRSNLGLGRPLRPRPRPTSSEGALFNFHLHPTQTTNLFPVKYTKYNFPSVNNQDNTAADETEDERTKSVPDITETTLSYDEMLTDSLPVNNIGEFSQNLGSPGESKNKILNNTIDGENSTTALPDASLETIVTTDILPTETESDISKEAETLYGSTLSPIFELQARQGKMPSRLVDYYNQTNRIEGALQQEDLPPRGNNSSRETMLTSKRESNKTKGISEVREQTRRIPPKNSFNVNLLSDKVLRKNGTLPLDIFFTVLTPVELHKNGISSIANNSHSNKNINDGVKTPGKNIKNREDDFLMNKNGKTVIEEDSWPILLGNYTLFHQKSNNGSNKDILNNETFRYLISPQYAKDNKKIKGVSSTGEEETAKSISLSYTVNNAGLALLTKTYNKIQTGSKDENVIEKHKTIPSAELQQNFTECTKSNSTFKCQSGECVSVMSRCNQLVDCPDGSDEKNCTCVEYLNAQFLTRKICDGVIDCWDLSDENKCAWCTPGQYVCSDSRICVNQDQLCDGNRDCPLGDDEKHCLTIAPSMEQAEDMVYHSKGFLMVRKKGKWGKLCIENLQNVLVFQTNWTIPEVGRAVCKAMTYSDFEEIRKKQDGEVNESQREVYFELSNIHVEADLSKYRPDTNLSQTTCTKNEVVHISCKDLQCGMRPQAEDKRNSNSSSNGIRRGLRHSRIVGGGNASPGSWPWQAALYKEGEFQCGATLISDTWLLSAGHCFYHALEDYWVARLGALRRGTSLPSPYEQLRPVSRILLHPGYIDTGFINDISLLQMKSPVKFTNYVRPICLPSPNTPIKDGSMCTVVGWGQLFEVGRIFPDTLQEVQLPVISTSECRKRTLFLPLYRVTENMLCAGYDRGGRDACLGDSGGPLMCQEADGRWSLLGVTSNGYGCARANRPGVYTKVSNYLSWVQSNIANIETIPQVTRRHENQSRAVCNGHRCPLGECLPLARVCNGYIECSDGSDEQNCW